MELSDIDLVIMSRAAGDDAAFGKLVRRHQARLRAFLHRLCGDGSLADDMAQDAFIKAHGALATFKGGGSFRSWLYSIAYREFLQLKRKEKAAQRLENALRADASHGISSASGADAGMSLDLQRALATLEPMERAAILLCDAAGLTNAEAATAIDAPLGSIKTYIARARDKMRAALSMQPAPPENEKTAPSPTQTGVKGALYAI